MLQCWNDSEIMNSSSLSNMARVGKHERESKCNSIEVLKTENEVFLLMDKAVNKHIQSLDSSEVTDSNVGANLFPIAEEGKFIGVFKPAWKVDISGSSNGLSDRANGFCMVEQYSAPCYDHSYVNHSSIELKYDYNEILKTLFFILIIVMENGVWMINYFTLTDSDNQFNVKLVKQCIILFSLLPFMINVLYFLNNYCSCSDNGSNHSYCLALSYPSPILMWVHRWSWEILCFTNTNKFQTGAEIGWLA